MVTFFITLVVYAKHMKKSEWLDCQRKEFSPNKRGFHHLVKIEHKNTATLDSARSIKKSKVAVLQLQFRRPMRTKKIIFLILNQNICCDYSKGPSQQDSSLEHPKYMFKLMGKKLLVIIYNFTRKKIRFI